MSFLLDTNMVSEWTKATPNPSVISWLKDADEDQTFLSVVTLAELRYGIDRMPNGLRRSRLGRWLNEDLPLRFENRILPISGAIADFWGRLTARSQAMGAIMKPMDAFLAATAHVHGLKLVTRNEADFTVIRHSLINPWRTPSE